LKTLYEILGVRRNASDATIKTAHRRLAKQLHPDMPGGSAERFREVDLAYKVLRDKARRRKYDKDGEYSEQAELTMAQRVTADLATLYTQAIEAGIVFNAEVDLVEAMLKVIEQSRSDHGETLGQVRERRTLLKKIINRITRDDKKPNIFEAITNEQIRRCDDQVEDLELKVRVCVAVRHELKNYRSLTETIRYQHVYFTSSSNSTTTSL